MKTTNDPNEADLSNTSLLNETIPPKLEQIRDDSLIAAKRTAKDYYTVAVLCFLNFINCMEKLSLAGILHNIQNDYQIGYDKTGLLQTSFILSVTFFVPIFGYLGDRFPRKRILMLGFTIYSVVTLTASFMPSYYTFLSLRIFIGIGEASYTTVASVIISDLFIKNKRSQMLALYYFIGPIGSGLGYMSGSGAASLLGSWRWAPRLTSLLCVFAVFILLFITDPKRGEREGGSHTFTSTSYRRDIKELSKTRSYILLTLGSSCMLFVTSGLSWWGPTYIHSGLNLNSINGEVKLASVLYMFGTLLIASNLIGVPMGIYTAQFFRKRLDRGDPMVCATYVFISVPLFFGAILMPSKSETATYVLIFFALVALNTIWALVPDILLYVVSPVRRSTATAFYIFFIHVFGDAGSPYIIGIISEALKTKFKKENSNFLLSENTNITLTNLEIFKDINKINFLSLQYALIGTVSVLIFSSFFYIMIVCYIRTDRSNASATDTNGNKNNLANCKE